MKLMIQEHLKLLILQNDSDLIGIDLYGMHIAQHDSNPILFRE